MKAAKEARKNNLNERLHHLEQRNEQLSLENARLREELALALRGECYPRNGRDTSFEATTTNAPAAATHDDDNDNDTAIEAATAAAALFSLSIF